MKKIVHIFCHPLWILVAFIAISLAVEENYPLSHYPMYSQLTESTYYFYLTTPEGHLLPVKRYFRYTASKLKKIYRTELRAISRSSGIPFAKLSSMHHREAGRRVLEKVWDTGARVPDQFLPDQLTLRRVDITLEKGKLHQNETILVTH